VWDGHYCPPQLNLVSSGVAKVPSRALTAEFAKIKIRRTRRREAFALFSAFFALYFALSAVKRFWFLFLPFPTRNPMRKIRERC